MSFETKKTGRSRSPMNGNSRIPYGPRGFGGYSVNPYSGMGGMNGPANQNMRPGDWLCFDCNYVNFASRKECNRCKTKKPDNYGAPIAPMMKDMYGMPPQRLDQQKEVRPNDWECPDCNVSNFENRDACFKCNIPKPENAILTISLKNWECGQCFASNHAKRRECFKCQCSKPEDAKEIESLKDWFCPSCSQMNAARRTNCHHCDGARPGREKELEANPDWKCGQCGIMNWSWRKACYKCSTEKSSD